MFDSYDDYEIVIKTNHLFWNYKVPVFADLDEQWLDALCGRLEQVLYTENSFIVREGDPVDEMLFVMCGKLFSVTTNGGRTGFFNSDYLKAGDFCGEELLRWALAPHSRAKHPISTSTVQALSEVEAFVLKADDLKFIASEFNWLHNQQLRHKFKFYSHQWRMWAACYIQAVWRRYLRKKMEVSLREEENRLRDALDKGRESSLSLGATIYASRFVTNAIRAIRQNGGTRTPSFPERILPTMPHKPAEPDVGAEELSRAPKGEKAASSSEVPSQARSPQKSSRDGDERYDKLSTQLEEVALAIKKLTDDRLNVNDLYDEVMKTEGFDELTLALAFDHLVENEKVAKAFMVKNERLRRAWLEGFLSVNA